MIFNLPRNNNLVWTQHSRAKLRQYNLSESRIKRVLRFPKRKEVGIAPETIACMQPAGSKKHPYEIWVMYQSSNSKSKILNSKQIQNLNVQNSKQKIYPEQSRRIKIISVWRYLGISPVHEPPPIPDEVWEILK